MGWRLELAVLMVALAAMPLHVKAQGVPVDANAMVIDGAGENLPDAWAGSDILGEAVSRSAKPQTWNVGDMPQVPAGEGIAAPAMAVASPTLMPAAAGLAVLPRIEEGEDLGSNVPAGAEALGRYGLAPRGVALRVGWDAGSAAALKKAWPQNPRALPAVVRGALVDVLVTPAEPPADADPMDWLAWRMRELLALGRAEDAWQLGQVVTPVARGRSRPLAEAWGLVHVVAGDTMAGCAALRNDAVGQGDISTLWRQAVMVCQALERGRDGLQLSLQLAEADGVAQSLNPLLKLLLNAVAVNGPAPRLPKGAVAGPLEAALYASFPALIVDEVWPQLPDLVLWRLVRTDGLPLAMRVQAAEWLMAKTGSVEAGNALTQLYGQFAFTGAQLNAPVAVAGQLKDPVMARGLLWQATRSGSGSVAEGAGASWRALLEAWNAHGLAVLAWQVAPPAVVVESGGADVLIVALEGAIWRGERGLAERLWRRLVAVEGLDTEHLRARARLGVLVHVLIGKDAGVWRDQWLAALPMATVGEKRRVLRQLAVWQALGVGLDATQQQQVLVRLGDVPGGTQWPVWQDLVASLIREGKRGEALAMVASTLEADPAAGHAAGWVSGAMAVLKDLGNAEAARRMALASVLPQQGDEAVVPSAPVAADDGVRPAPEVRAAPAGGVPATAATPAATAAAATLFLPMPSDAGAARDADWLLPPPRVEKPVVAEPEAPRFPRVPDL